MTIDEKVRVTLGHLMIENIAFGSRVEDLTKQVDDLKAQLEAAKKPE